MIPAYIGVSYIMEKTAKLSPKERVLRCFQEIALVRSLCDLTDWELKFLEGNKENKFASFTPRMEISMQQIEKKLFGTETVAPTDQIEKLPSRKEQRVTRQYKDYDDDDDDRPF